MRTQPVAGLDARRRPLGRSRRRRDDDGRGCLVSLADRHPHALVLDLDLADTALLDDLHDLPDALGACRIDVVGDERRRARVARPDRLQQRLGLLAEHCEQDEVLLGRGEVACLIGDVLDGRRALVGGSRRRAAERHEACHLRIDRARGDAVPTLDQLLELLAHLHVAAREEDVVLRLRGEDLADRRGQRRRARLFSDHPELVERVEQAVARCVDAQVQVERGDERRREVVFGRAYGDPGRGRRDRLVADVLVDDVRGLPEPVDVDARLAPETVQRLDERLAGDAMQDQRQRIDGGGDQVGADACRDDRVQEACAGRALDVETDRKTRCLCDPLHELLGEVGLQRVRGIVDDDARGAETGDPLRLLDERVDDARLAGAEDEPGMERLAGGDDRLARLPEVGHVVQWVVQPEDVDAVLCRAGDEPADDVGADRLRADEEAPSQGDSERCPGAGVDGTDALPRALDGAPHRGVEDASAGDLEAGEPGPVEDLRDAEHLPRGHLTREFPLRQEPDRRVDQLWHERGTLPRLPPGTTGSRSPSGS